MRKPISSHGWSVAGQEVSRKVINVLQQHVLIVVEHSPGEYRSGRSCKTLKWNTRSLESAGY